MADIGKKSERSFLGYIGPDIEKFKKYAGYTLFTFAVMYAFFYNGRQNIGLALPSMQSEMGWSKSEVGIITSVLFWTYGFGHLINGRLGEMLGPKRFIIAGVLLSVICNVSLSFQNTLFAIAVLWGLNGYFQSMVWCPGVNLVSRWWPSTRRGFATGVFTGCAGVASFITWISVLAAFQFFPEDGWRAAFRYPILLILAAVLAFGLLARQKQSDVGLKDYVDEDAEAQQQDEENLKEMQAKGRLYPFLFLFGNWRFNAWCLIAMASSICRYGLLTWIPSYYVNVMNMNIKTGIVGSLVLPVGMALGSFLIPWGTDRMGRNGKLYAVIACSCVAGLMAFLFPTLSTVSTAAVGLFLTGFFVYAINGVLWVYAGSIGGRAYSGTAAGILDWAAYMGAALQAILFGYILDAGGWNTMFQAIAAMCVTMAVLAFIASRGQNK